MSTHAFGFVILKLHMWNEHKIVKSSDIPAINIWSNNLSSTNLLVRFFYTQTIHYLTLFGYAASSSSS